MASTVCLPFINEELPSLMGVSLQQMLLLARGESQSQLHGIKNLHNMLKEEMEVLVAKCHCSFLFSILFYENYFFNFSKQKNSKQKGSWEETFLVNNDISKDITFCLMLQVFLVETGQKAP